MKILGHHQQGGSSRWLPRIFSNRSGGGCRLPCRLGEPSSRLRSALRLPQHRYHLLWFVFLHWQIPVPFFMIFSLFSWYKFPRPGQCRHRDLLEQEARCGRDSAHTFDQSRQATFRTGVIHLTNRADMQSPHFNGSEDDNGPGGVA